MQSALHNSIKIWTHLVYTRKNSNLSLLCCTEYNTFRTGKETPPYESSCDPIEPVGSQNSPGKPVQYLQPQNKKMAFWAHHCTFDRISDFHSNLSVSWGLVTEVYEGIPTKFAHFKLIETPLPGSVILWF